ncbi:MAG: phosphoesterase [Gammaproteobacteria bacterium]|nr:phosphoesterase [Gammaproteobacteria bacterium]
MPQITSKTPKLIIYHASCSDGFAAALAAKMYFDSLNHGNEEKLSCEFYAAKHGYEPPDCQNKDVYIVDFSYKKKQIIDLCEDAEHVTIIDHHISAQRDLEGLENKIDNLDIIFDMSHSGAVLSWQFFHETPVPLLFKYIEDRDIWKFELDDTDDILAAVSANKMSFKLWLSWINDETSLKALKNEGSILNRSKQQQIDKYLKRARISQIAGYTVPVVNAPSNIVSDLLQILSKDYPFAISYEDREDRRVWQLRSSGKNAEDVSEVAKLFGGGGHKNASGFSTPLIQLPAEIMNKPS